MPRRMATGAPASSSQQQHRRKDNQPASPRTELNNSTRPPPATESRFSGFARMLQFTPAASRSQDARADPPSNSTDVIDLLNTLETENARLRALTASPPRKLPAELAAQRRVEEARADARTQMLARALILIAFMLLSFAAGLRLGAGAAGAPAEDHRGMSWRPATSSPRHYKSPGPNGVGLLHVTAVEPGLGYAGRFSFLRLGPRRPHVDRELQTRLFASLRH